MFIAKNRNGPDGLVFPMFIDTSAVQLKILAHVDTPVVSPSMEPHQLAAALTEKYKLHRKFENARKEATDGTT